MHTKDIVNKISFGSWVAEQEKEDLHKYFVKTNLWKQIDSGDVDIVYGQKGSGKSALFYLINETLGGDTSRNIICAVAENMSGDPAFSQLIHYQDDITDQELKNIWSFYFAAICIKTLIDRGYNDGKITELANRLDRLGYADIKATALSRLISTVREYVKTVSLDRQDVTGRIVFREPTIAERKNKIVSINSIFEIVKNPPAERVVLN